MCVPLLTPDGQALGILQLDTSDRRQFLQDDLDVLAAVASQAAIAVQNASMHESLARARAARARPEAGRAGAEAVFAAIGSERAGFRVLRPLSPGV